MRYGLVLEGGAMRGMFTCGVIDVFMENKITFDGAIGVSAGACFGCNIKSEQIGRPIRYNKKYCADKRYASWFNIIKEGSVFGVKFCYEEIPFVLDKWDNAAFEKNPMDFYIVCTDAKTGKPVYYKCTDGMNKDIEYMRASASMPIVSRVVKVGDERLVDGGVADSIPIRHFESLGYDKNIVVLTQPKGYVKKSSKIVPLARMVHFKYPNIAKAMKIRHENYNDSVKYIAEGEKKGTILAIRPPEPLNIPHITKDPNELERVYQIGRQTAYDMLDDVKRFLALI